MVDFYLRSTQFQNKTQPMYS